MAGQMSAALRARNGNAQSTLIPSLVPFGKECKMPLHSSVSYYTQASIAMKDLLDILHDNNYVILGDYRFDTFLQLQSASGNRFRIDIVPPLASWLEVEQAQ